MNKAVRRPAYGEMSDADIQRALDTAYPDPVTEGLAWPIAQVYSGMFGYTIAIHPFSRGECRACGRVLARTRGSNGTLIAHGPLEARCCPGSGQQPKCNGESQ